MQAKYTRAPTQPKRRVPPNLLQMTQAADIAELLKDNAYDKNRQMPAVAPGSFEEDEALSAIDNARAESLAQLAETFAVRQKRRAAYWRPRGVRS